VIDGSLMPTGGAINPTSTIGSVALRCADYLANNFDEIA
jgi:choline dehydrogenase-like flavoprotein